MQHILLIDDDLPFCDLTSRYLTVEGFDVQVANTAQQGFKIFKESAFDLVLLDVMLPEECGFDILNLIRQESFVPIIMYSALTEEINEIIALESGADGYVKKSSHPRVLTAKIHSILRRSKTVLQKKQVESIIVYDDIQMNQTKRLVYQADCLIDLTQTEFNLLSYLLQHIDQVISKKELSLQVLGKKLGPYDRSIDTHISRIRSKFNIGENGMSFITTIQGVGYRISCNDNI